MSGPGETNRVADLPGVLVDIIQAPVIDKAPNSLISVKTLHDAKYTLVSAPGFTALKHQDEEESHLAVPDGNMVRMPTLDLPKVNVEVNAAIASATLANVKRLRAKIMAHRKRRHRPKDGIDCDDCRQMMRRKPAKRLASNLGASRICLEARGKATCRGVPFGAQDQQH